MCFKVLVIVFLSCQTSKVTRQWKDRSRTVTLIAPTIDISPHKAVLIIQQFRQSVIKIKVKSNKWKNCMMVLPMQERTLLSSQNFPKPSAIQIMQATTTWNVKIMKYKCQVRVIFNIMVNWLHKFSYSNILVLEKYWKFSDTTLWTFLEIFQKTGNFPDNFSASHH